MDLDCPHLSLAPHWAAARDPRRIFLVPDVDALGLCRRAEFEIVPAWETVALAALDSDGLAARLAQFVSDNSAVRSLPHDQRVAWATQAIEHGTLVGVRRVWQGGAEGDGVADQRRLVGEIERAVRGPLSQGGRRYKLVAGADEGGIGDRNRYEVVRREDAVRVLRAIAAESHGPPNLRTLLGQAEARVSPDWRSPFLPNGLVLLRRIAARAADSQPAAALTPSQMRAMMGDARLAIHVVDLNGKPQAGLAFAIRKPDGGTAQGKLDEAGRAHAESSAPGIFTVTFPDLDGDDWTGDGVLELDQDGRTEASRHKVEQGERLSTIARKHGFARWRTIWDFVGNLALKELRGTAHVLKRDDEVSIPCKLERSAEVPGGSAKYVVQVAPEVLRVRFAGLSPSEDEPITFKAKPDTGELIERPLEANGWMEIDLPPHASRVKVELLGGEDAAAPEPFATYELKVGAIDPLREISGVQARLFNLGYYHGDISGQLDEETRAAIAHFRWARLHDSQQDMDAAFLEALRRAYGV